MIGKLKGIGLALATLCLALALPQAGHAQANTLVQTTLSAAVSSTAQTIFNVTSATGIQTPTGVPGTATMMFIDREMVSVTAVNGTLISVARGQGGTAASTHANGAMILLGRPNWFYNYDPAGSCTTANTFVTPWLNTRTGDQWLCSTVTTTWVPGFGNNHMPPVVTTAVASAAGAIVPSGPMFHVTGTSAITGFTVPIGCDATAVASRGCMFVVIPDAVFTYTAAGNIAPASTGINAGTAVVVVNQPITFVWDQTTSKFHPNTQ